MNNAETKKFEMGIQLKEFGKTYNANMEASALIKELFESLAPEIPILETSLVNQLAAQRTGRGKIIDKVKIKNDLMSQLSVISQTAKLISPVKKEFAEKFSMPTKRSERHILAAAQGFLADATPYEKDFITHEMHADFLAKLQTTIQTFDQLITESDQVKEKGATATKAIKKSLAKIMAIAKQLDRLIKNKFSDNQEILDAYERARHIEKLPRAAPKVVVAPVEPAK